MINRNKFYTNPTKRESDNIITAVDIVCRECLMKIRFTGSYEALYNKQEDFIATHLCLRNIHLDSTNTLLGTLNSEYN